MAMGLKMSMKLSQQLRMTPQLQQAIKLLQMSRMELETAVRKELVENPVLEEVQDGINDDPALANNQTKDDIQSQDDKSKDSPLSDTAFILRISNLTSEELHSS